MPTHPLDKLAPGRTCAHRTDTRRKRRPTTHKDATRGRTDKDKDTPPTASTQLPVTQLLLPTVTQLLCVLPIDSATIGPNSDPVVVRAGDDVFIRAAEEDEDEDEGTGAVHWIMRVTSIHRWQGEIWLVGRWFYSWEDALQLTKISTSQKKLLDHLGGGELLLSNHYDVAAARTINDIATVYKLVEGPGEQMQFGLDDWYYRWRLESTEGRGWRIKDVIVTCICGKPYSPEEDIQRWCHRCSLWYHQGCLQPIVQLDEGEQAEVSDCDEQGDSIISSSEPEEKREHARPAISKEDLERLERGAIVRGLGGAKPADVPEWSITGTNSFIKKCREQLNRKRRIRDKQVTEELGQLLNQRLLSFHCPRNHLL